ncbi:MAG: DUF4268 domain-containing protein [Candidatus Bipolaricaulis sp.]|nr:DUF4268 domain-containing protein [Candidatus Bipolaricaulis sp.]
MVARIERVPLREVWPHEEADFTPWLQDNLDVLNAATDLSLTSAERERDAGDFSVDLVAEDEQGNTVVIENQLDRSNHDHLGKLITYLTALDARTGVWIVSDPRPEHVRAITWLNETRPASFYLLKLEAIRIGGSEPAPLLTLIVGPSEEGREAGETKQEIAERYEIRHRFWAGLLDYARTRTKLHANISPSESSWVGTSAGAPGLRYEYKILKHAGSAYLYIDFGKGGDEQTKAYYDRLAASRDAIEEVFGGPLEWKKTEGVRSCRISAIVTVGGYRDDEERWPLIHEALVDAMIRLDKALNPYISKLGR